MSYAQVLSLGGEAFDLQLVEIEVHLSRGLPSFHIVGLPEKAVRESRDRVKSALLSAQFQFPRQKVVVGLAPAELPKEGSHLDLAIAIGILIASGQVVPKKDLSQLIWAGELGLAGNVRTTSSTISLAIAAQKVKKQLILARKALLPDVLQVEPYVLGVESLHEASGFLEQKSGYITLPKVEVTNAVDGKVQDRVVFEDIQGNEIGKVGVLLAISGGHSLLLEGCPGVGKTMLACSAEGIIPDLEKQELLNVAQIYSMMGEIRLSYRPPFRAPHHMISVSGLLGGGQIFFPGEMSLAHQGILFLDELTEYNRLTLDHLREPLVSGKITISKSSYRKNMPSRCILIAAMNPCPCGNFGIHNKDCICGYREVIKYRSCLSGPFIDRMDIHVKLSRTAHKEIKDDVLGRCFSMVSTSRRAASVVMRARKRQIQRQGRLNYELTIDEMLAKAKNCKKIRMWIDEIRQEKRLSMRGVGKTLSLAYTFMDCMQEDKIDWTHISMAEKMRIFV